MGIVYQLTFFVALGLLATVVTIFVFAVSQVGRATESASRQQQSILLKQKKAETSRIDRIQAQLEEAKKTGQLDEPKLSKELEETKQDIIGYDTELRRIHERIVLIRRKGAVIYPGAGFLVTLALSVAASGLTEAQDLSTLALWLWIISICSLAFGVYRVFRTLGAIEEVTITSKEAIEKLPEAVKIALRELEEEKRPELELVFVDEPPFRVETQSERLIEYSVRLSRGDIARDVIAAFFTPANFEYPDNPAKLAVPQTKYEDYNSARINLGDIKRPFAHPKSLKLKAPAEPGHYIAAYKLYCEGYFSDFVEFEIEVEEQEIPF